MRAAGSDPLPGTGGEGLEQPAFVKAKCVTLSVGFHTAIWNQHLQSVCQNRYADLETGCAAESIGNCRQFHEDNQLPTGSPPQKGRD